MANFPDYIPAGTVVPTTHTGALQESGPGLYSSEDIDRSLAIGGFSRQIKDRSDAYNLRVTEAQRLLADVITGRVNRVFLQEAMRPSNEYLFRAVMHEYPGLFPVRGNQIEGVSLGLRETMSYTDYSALTVDILDRALYGYYNAAPLTTMPLVKQKDLRDFRLVARYQMDGAVTPFKRMPSDTSLTPHAAGEPPTERAMTQEAYEVQGSTQRITYQPQLYQGMMAVNWRAMINDDLGIFADMTNRLAISGNETISTFITSLYWSTTGPNTTLFNSTFANQCIVANGATTNNPPLSFQGLNDAITILAQQKNSDGQPIVFSGTLYLVVPPALITTAEFLAQSFSANLSILGGNQNPQGFPTAFLNAPNLLGRKVTPLEDKWIPVVSNSNANANRSWMLVYDPSVQPRPSVEMGFLTGYKTPQLYQKVPNTMRIGGGVDPGLGDFFSMDLLFKGLIVVGGTQIDGRSCIVSTGAGQ